MPPRFSIWNNHGSNDEYAGSAPLTGKEWRRCFRYMTSKTAYVTNCFFCIFTQFSPYIGVVLRGKIISILIDETFDSPREFLHVINKYSFYLILEVFRNALEMTFVTFLELKFTAKYLSQLRILLTKSLLSHDISFFDKIHTGILLSRLTEDCNQVRFCYTMHITGMINSFGAWIAGFVITIYYDWGAAFLGIIAMCAYAFCQFLGNKTVDRLSIEHTERVGHASAKAEEILTSMRTVKSFDAEYKENQIYKERLDEVAQTTLAVAHIHGLREAILLVIQYGAYSLLMKTTGMRVLSKKIEPGALSTLLGVFNRWNFSFNGVFSILMDFKQSNVSAAKLLEILEEKSKIETTFQVDPLYQNQAEIMDDHEYQTFSNAIGKIEFKDVIFRYEGRNENALNKLNFSVEPGETIAIVGESGCGKSTTLQLLMRFYDPIEGQILIDGKDITSIYPSDIRRQIAMVPQNPIIFSLTARDNIRFGIPKAKKQDVFDAAMIANAHSFVRELSEGYRTHLQQNSLSGGQKQRICIARAVMLRAPILLLDEATAALDTESEKLVQEALYKYKNGRTVILVAHRLATVMSANRILVMDKGAIVEEGTHDQLLAKGGLYAELVKHQLQ